MSDFSKETLLYISKIISSFKEVVHIYENQYKYELVDNKKDKFLNESILPFVSCYISIEELKTKKDILNITYDEILKSYFPDKPHIVSGDFGEILGYYFFHSLSLPKKLKAPKKWRWKESKNKPTPFTDIVLFYKKETKPNKKDMILSVEVKTRSTSYQGNPIKKAIEGTKKDLTRLTQAIDWFREKAVKEANQNDIEYYERFLNPDIYGEYLKKYNALIVIDKELLNKKEKKESDFYKIDSDNISIYILSIAKLKEYYQNFYKEMRNIKL